MKVLKFGGGIIKDPESVKRIPEVLGQFRDDDLLIVVSAMNKMTNAFEKLVALYFEEVPEMKEQLDYITGYHEKIAETLFPSAAHPVHDELNGLIENLRSYLNTRAVPQYNFEYDQVVPYGEMFSSVIIHHWLANAGLGCRLFDARQLIRTDNKYREAIPDMQLTGEAIVNNMGSLFSDHRKGRHNVALTQGFIGGATNGHFTTLGREGSDYSAAIFAWALNAGEVVIWKDVPGILSADPGMFDDGVKLERLSYKEALELAFYGAKVIHPKTIRPLQEKKIPLRVRSFYDLEDPGTIIFEEDGIRQGTPSVIIKKNQLLITIFPPGVALLTAEHISKIFKLLHQNSSHVNVMQNSASSFSICIDDPDQRHENLLRGLQGSFRIRFNEGLDLVTIRNYNKSSIRTYIGKNTVLLEQKTRSAARFVVRPDGSKAG